MHYYEDEGGIEADQFQFLKGKVCTCDVADDDEFVE